MSDGKKPDGRTPYRVWSMWGEVLGDFETFEGALDYVRGSGKNTHHIMNMEHCSASIEGGIIQVRDGLTDEQRDAVLGLSEESTKE